MFDTSVPMILSTLLIGEYLRNIKVIKMSKSGAKIRGTDEYY